jgi:AcrR family transcriptional regulator
MEATLARGTGARQAMMLAGERLFAERGFRGVSLREIGAAAGQRNNSAAQYHFGSRLGLAEAIFGYRMAVINEQRVARLDRLAAEDRRDDLRGIMEALVVPLAEAIGSPSAPSYYARFASQLAFDPELDFIGRLDRPFLTGLKSVIEGMLRCLDHLPPAVAQVRIHLTLRLVTVALSSPCPARWSWSWGSWGARCHRGAERSRSRCRHPPGPRPPPAARASPPAMWPAAPGRPAPP